MKQASATFRGKGKDKVFQTAKGKLGYAFNGWQLGQCADIK